MSKTDEEKNTKNLPTQASLCIRGIAGCYLLYLAYDLFTGRGTSTFPLWALILVLILFVVGGGFFIFNAISCYIKGTYVGGKADVDDEEDKDAGGVI